MIGGFVKGQLEKLGRPLFEGLYRMGISPNLLTFTGLGLSLLASALLWMGSFRVAGLFMLAGGLCDMLDGGVARVRGLENRLGAFLDSIVDRYSDLFLLTGLTLYFAGQGNVALVGLCCLAMIGTSLVPYARARAECFLPKCTVGWMERPERILVLAAGALFQVMDWAVGILALLANLTVLQRIHYCWRELPRGGGSIPLGEQGNEVAEFYGEERKAVFSQDDSRRGPDMGRQVQGSPKG
ncbi:MAG: CDP-alcohol phosphatidyltransferase family protein [bacterium]